MIIGQMETKIEIDEVWYFVKYCPKSKIAEVFRLPGYAVDPVDSFSCESEREVIQTVINRAMKWKK